MPRPMVHGGDHGPGGSDPTPVSFAWRVIPVTTTITTGDKKDIWNVPYDMDSMRLVFLEGAVATVSSSGVVTVQLRNITQSWDILSTKLTIDASEKHSKTAATPFVIDVTGNDVVLWADEIACDIDTAGTGAQGLLLNLWLSRTVDLD